MNFNKFTYRLQLTPIMSFVMFKLTTIILQNDRLMTQIFGC